MKKILIALLVGFIIIQFFPIDKTNPPVNKGMDFLVIKKTPEDITALVRNSCYDCHSNESKYPWYSNIAPFSWLLKNHIDEGRHELNFSLFSTYEPKRQARKLQESIEMIEQDEMPLESYLLMHPEAKLSAENKKALMAYFKRIKDETMLMNDLTEEDLHRKRK